MKRKAAIPLTVSLRKCINARNTQVASFLASGQGAVALTVSGCRGSLGQFVVRLCLFYHKSVYCRLQQHLYSNTAPLAGSGASCVTDWASVPEICCVGNIALVDVIVLHSETAPSMMSMILGLELWFVSILPSGTR
jgi:hypothetical protein